MSEVPERPVPTPAPRRGGIGRWLLRLLHVAVAGVIVAVFGFVGAMALGLLFGPVSLGPLAPVLIRTVSESIAGYRMTASDALLVWSSEQSRLVIRFVEPRLVDENGVEVATASDIGASFSISALMDGSIAPRSLEIVGPTATFMRMMDGTYDIGIRTESRRPDNTTEDADIGPLIEALLEPPVRGKVDTYLSEVRLSEATLTFIDQATETIVKAPRGTFVLQRRRAGITATLEGQVSLPGGNWAFAATAGYDRGAETITVDARLDDAVLGSLPDTGPLFDIFTGLNVPLKGEVKLTLDRDGRILAANANVTAKPGRLEVEALGKLPVDVKAATVDAAYDATTNLLELRALSIESEKISGAITGQLRFAYDTAGLLTGWAANLALRDGRIDAPAYFDAPTRVDVLDLTATNDHIADSLTIDRFHLDSDGTIVDLAGQVFGLEAGKPAIRMTGALQNIPVERIGALWPKGLAAGARDWITANAFGGRLTGGTIAVDISAEELNAERAPNDAARIEIAYEDVEIRYIEGLPHLTDVTGTAVVMGNRFETTIASAKGGNLSISDGLVVIDDLVTHGEPAVINAVVSGTATDLLALLDMKPLGYPSRFGLDPKQVSGKARVDVGLTVPTWAALNVDDIGFDIKAQLSDAALNIAKGIRLTNGEALFAVTGEGLTAEGEARIAGVVTTFRWDENFSPGPGVMPTKFSARAAIDESLRVSLGVDPGAYLDGIADVSFTMTGRGFDPATASVHVDLANAALKIPELGYAKAVGAPAVMTAELTRVAGGYHAAPVRLEGEGIDAELEILLSETGALRSVKANRLVAGRNDVGFTVTLDGGQPTVVAEVEVIDLDTLVNALMDPAITVQVGDEPQPTAPSDPPNVKMNIRAKRVLLRDGQEARDFWLDVDLDRGYLTELLVDGKIGEGKLAARLWTRDDGSRHVAFESDAMGPFIHGLTGFGSLQGGAGRLDLTFPKVGAAGNPAGLFTMKDFRLTEQPFIVRLLASGSFQGLIDLLMGEGIWFDRLSAGVTMAGSRIEVRDLAMSGPSAGALGDGFVDRDSGALEATGSLAPIYTLNTILADVPLVGDVLGGEGGIVALTFAISGNVDELALSVNPLSAVAPGFLRQLFEFPSPLGGEAPVLPAIPLPVN